MIQPGWSSLSLFVPARSNNFCVGGHLFVKDGKGWSNRLFDKHADQDTFGRPIGEGAVNLSAVLDLALLFVGITFRDYTLLYRECQSSAQRHHHHFGVDVLFYGCGRLAAKGFDLYPRLKHLVTFLRTPADLIQFTEFWQLVLYSI